MSFMFNVTVTNNGATAIENLNIRTVFDQIDLDEDIARIEPEGTIEFQCTCGGAYEERAMSFCTNNGYVYGMSGMVIRMEDVPEDPPE